MTGSDTLGERASETVETTRAGGAGEGHTAFQYRPALDGLRGVAVLLVIVFHVGATSLRNGYVGVDAFFVLSGFLVTSILITELSRSGSLQLSVFYARRVRRLLPASAAVILSVAVIWPLVAPVAQLDAVAADARAAALYFANWQFIISGTNYEAELASASPLVHFWSLSIEEQFYFVFPLVLFALWRLTRRNLQLMLVAIGSLLAVSLYLQFSIASSGSADRAYFGTDTRMYQPLLGAAASMVVALVIRRHRAWRFADAIGLVALVVLATGLVEVSRSMRGLLAAGATVLLIGALEFGSETSWTRRMLTSAPLLYLGKRSYGLYLWHWPVVLLTERLLGAEGVLRLAIVLVVSSALAELSYNLLEQPIRHSTSLHRVPRAVVVGGIALSVVTALLAPVLLSGTEGTAAPTPTRTAGVVDERLADALGPAPKNVDWRAVTGRAGNVPDIPNCENDDPDSCFLVRSDGDTVLLIGDSHARTMVPYMTEWAEERGLSLAAAIIPGCGWPEGVRRNASDDKAICDERRDNWTTDLIDAVDARHVVMYQRLPPDSLYRSGSLELTDPELQAAGYPDGYYEVMERTVRRLGERDVNVVIIESTPFVEEGDPLDCLSTATRVYDCSWLVPFDAMPEEVLLRSLDEEFENVTVIDVDDIACPMRPLCVPYLDERFTYRDWNHVHPDWWQDNQTMLDDRLDPLLLGDA